MDSIDLLCRDLERITKILIAVAQLFEQLTYFCVLSSDCLANSNDTEIISKYIEDSSIKAAFVS